MDGLFNLDMDNGGKTVLNAGNGLTFCIEVGENEPNETIQLSEKEPSIALIESVIENDSNLESSNQNIVLEVGDPEVNSHYRSYEPVLQKRKGSSSLSRSNNSGVSKSFNNRKRNKEFSKSKVYLFSKKIKAKEGRVTTKRSKFSDFQDTDFLSVTSKKSVNKIFDDSKETLFILKKPHSENVNSRLNSSTSGSDYSSTSQSSENISFIERPSLHLVKDEMGKYRDSPILIEPDNSKTIYWEEGNIDVVTDYISLSESLINQYPLSKVFEKPLELDYSNYMPNIEMYESPVGNRLGVSPGVNLYLSWEAVKNRIEELQDLTQTRFILDYKTPTFKDDPKPFKRIHLELDTLRRGAKNTIPNNGIPFLFLGTCIYTCHLGNKKRCGKDNLEEELSNGIRSKKIGCPASISITKIARFPDFDVSGLNRACETDVLQEVSDKWDFKNSRIRYYVEYHVREPQTNDHKGHEVMFLVNNNRFKELVDPRILEKIRDLTRQGVFKTKIVREKINDFIQQELFKGSSAPPLDRRKYNPSERDVRYAILKAKEELKKEGKNIMQLECSALARDLSEALKNVTEDEYLKQVRYYLTLLLKAVRLKQPLETFFLTSSLGFNNFTTTPVKKTPKVILREEEIDSPPSPLTEEIAASSVTTDFFSTVPSSSSGVNFSDQVIEQFYVNSNDDVAENEFNATQIYGSQDLVDLNPSLIEGLPSAGGDGVTGVYYYFTDGAGEMAAPALVTDHN